jgi:hypothetical protein
MEFEFIMEIQFSKYTAKNKCTLKLFNLSPYLRRKESTIGDSTRFAMKSHIGPIGRYLMCSPLAKSRPSASNISIVANPRVLPIFVAFVNINTSLPAGIGCRISVDK